MLTDPNLRSQIDALWDKLWTGGLSNPLDAIEQLSFLLFLKRLDEAEQDRERDIRLHRTKRGPIFPDPKLRWSYWTNLKADEALKHVKEKVFPFIKTLGGSGGSFAEQMANAEFKINKPSLLIEACKAIDAMQISAQNQDVQGDLYEYLLGRLNTAGMSGQFRTPRHIIRMMVKMLDPKPRERMCDPAAGTCGFPVNVYQHILETHTDPTILKYDEEGYPHQLIGDKLSKAEHDFMQTKAITAYDSDSGMELWAHQDSARFTELVSGPGPRATPTIHEGKIYAQGAPGRLDPDLPRRDPARHPYRFPGSSPAPTAARPPHRNGTAGSGSRSGADGRNRSPPRIDERARSRACRPPGGPRRARRRRRR